MQRSHSNDTQTSLLANLYCDADLVTPLIVKGEKVMVRSRCPGTTIGVIDCHCFDLQRYIDDAGGLEIESKPITGLSPKISQDIPVIPREWFNRSPHTIESDVVGVRLGDILDKQLKSRWGHYSLSDEVKIDLSALASPVFEGKRLVLFTSGPDVMIEKLWWARAPLDLFRKIAEGNFYAVTGMNFSLFLYECPLGHLINMNKSLLFSQELSKLGVPVIPHIYAVNDSQRAKWIEYLNHNPDIITVTINTQLQRTNAAMQEVVYTIEALVAKTRVNIILNGFKPKGLPTELVSRVYIANQHGLKRRAIIESAIKSQQTSTS